MIYCISCGAKTAKLYPAKKECNKYICSNCFYFTKSEGVQEMKEEDRITCKCELCNVEIIVDLHPLDSNDDGCTGIICEDCAKEWEETFK